MAQKQLMSQEEYEKLLARLEELKKEQKQNIIDVQDARSQGDLSENADYAAAREKQRQIAREMEEVEYNIKNAEIIKESDTNNMLKYVTVRFIGLEGDDDVDKETYQIVGSVGADALNGKISSDSPLGKAILYAKVGDKVLVRTEDGDRFDVEVLKISSKGKK